MNFLSQYFSGKQIFRLILLRFIVCRKQIHRGVLLVSLQISEARKIPPQCLMSMMTPVYFPQFAQTTGEESVILLSSAVQMETTLGIMHHLHSTTCNAGKPLALLSSLSTSPFLQRTLSVHSNSRIHTQLTNLIKGPYTLSQC